MTTAEALATEFVRTRPVAAARALEALAPEHAARFIATLEPRLGTQLLREFLPAVATRCMECLPEENLSAMLALLPATAAAGLLRRTERRRRQVLLRAMGRMRAGIVEVLLSYPENVIGAWADPGVPLLREGMRAADAQRLVRASADANDDRVFVVDAAQRVRAHVSSARLAGATRRQLVDELAERSDCSLPASCRLEDAARADCWRETRSVAVIDRRGELVGVLRYAQLLAAIERGETRAAQPVEDNVAGLVDILLGGVSAEWDAWADLLGAAGGDRDGRR